MTRGRLAALGVAMSVALLLVAAGLLVGPFADREAAVASEGSSLGLAARAAVASFFGTESEFLKKRGELLAVLEANRERLAPKTLATFLENLEIIDQNIVEVAAAHAENPDHARLSRLLAAACQRELELLQRAAEVADAHPSKG